jgi:uncharacterized membrane protein
MAQHRPQAGPKEHGSEIEKEFELERMILFSDAIFAIAITLMVIDIKWPDISGGIQGVDVYALLKPTISQFIVFALSFFFIGRSWAQHLRLCRLLRGYDQGLINYNLLYLFFIVMFPFTASGVVGHVTTGFILPLLLYSFNMAAVSVMHFLIARYILRKKPELSVPSDAAEKKYTYLRGLYASSVMVALFLLIILIAILTRGNPNYMSFVYLLIPFGLRFAGRKAKKYKPKSNISA